MDVALERRAQLGVRLRALVRRSEALQSQVQSHARRIQRIRELYGLPEVPAGTSQQRGPSGRPETIFAAAILHARNVVAGMETSLARTDALIVSLSSWERQHPDDARVVPAVLPLLPADAVLTTGYGSARNPVTGAPEFHAGLDFAAPAGEIIRSPAAGIVRWAGDAPPNVDAIWWRLGHIVVVAHGNRYRTLYGHCDRLLVRTGQHVAAGDALATVGSTGWTAAPRLHYEVRRRDAEGEWLPVDPRSLLLDFEALAVPAPAEPGGPGGAAALEPPELPRAFAR